MRDVNVSPHRDKLMNHLQKGMTRLYNSHNITGHSCICVGKINTITIGVGEHFLQGKGGDAFDRTSAFSFLNLRASEAIEEKERLFYCGKNVVLSLKK